MTDPKVKELASWLRKYPTKKRWKDVIQAFAFKHKMPIEEVIKMVKENMDYIKGGVFEK